METGLQEQKKNKSRYRGVKAVIIITIILVVLMSAFLFSYKYVINSHNNADKQAEVVVPAEEAIEIQIPMGSSTEKISRILQEKGMIRYPYAFKLISKLNGYDGLYKSGTHLVSMKLDYDKLMRVLTSQPVSKTVTIPEGFNFREITKRYTDQGLVDREKFIKTANTELFNYKFLQGVPQRENRLEGYLFPDTYSFDMKVGEKEIVKKMLENFEKVFRPEYLEQAKKINLTLDQVIILASIIEKEAKYTEDRKLVSSVFQNRLSGKYSRLVTKKLESCATIQYIFYMKEDIIKEKIYEKDTKIKDPYNTYDVEGLPPGPICSPGKASIEAALYPEKTDYLFFVAKGDGHHQFSKTLAEHQAAMKKYGVN